MKIDVISGCFFGSSLASNPSTPSPEAIGCGGHMVGCVKAASREWNSLEAAEPCFCAVEVTKARRALRAA